MGVGQAFQPARDRVSRDRVSRVRDAAITTKGRLESPPDISPHPQFMNTTSKEPAANAAAAACAGLIERIILDDLDDVVGSGAGFGGNNTVRERHSRWLVCYTRDESVEGVFRSS